MVNPSAAAVLQTPAQVGAALAQLVHGNIGQVGDLSGFLTPAFSLALAEAARQNSFGTPYKPGVSGAGIAYDQLVKGLPQYTLGQRISDALNGKGADKQFPPSVASAIEQYTLGSIAPRKGNRAAMNSAAAREKAGR